jgi:uncharacterized membrane protein YgdD (TMEM256/DUF423 family)
MAWERAAVEKGFLALGSAVALVAVATGAFGAHALSAYFQTHPDLKSPYETGVQYLFYHGLGLLAVAWAVGRFGGPLVNLAGWLLLAGCVMFSGSLFMLSLTGVRVWGAVTPLGGVAFLAGWALLIRGALRG